MGEVINMFDRPRKKVENPVATEAAVRHIGELMRQSIITMRDMPGLGTVYMREKAVIKATELAEQAHKEAAAIGYEIITDGDALNGYNLVIRERKKD